MDSLPFPVSSLETPSLLVNLPTLQENISRIQNLSSLLKVKCRPHIKTHKCCKIAKLQIDAGAVGITCSKVDEALSFIDHQDFSFRDVTLAYPIIDERKLSRLFGKASTLGCRLGLIIDSFEGINSISKMAEKHYSLLNETIEKKIRIFIKIDVGLGRVGVDPEKNFNFLLELISVIKSKELSGVPIEFKGILSHAGNSYASQNLSQVLDVVEQEVKILSETSETLISRHNITVPEISVGSTPTIMALLHNSSDSRVNSIHLLYQKYITEIRPGNYVFNDLTQLSKNIICSSWISFSVLTTIVSMNEYYCICDTGSKVLTSDKAPHSSSTTTPPSQPSLSSQSSQINLYSLLSNYGIAIPLNEYSFFLENFLIPNTLSNSFHSTNSKLHFFPIKKVSEEHGWIEIDSKYRNELSLKIGSLLRIIPNHSCPVANLSHFFHITQQNSFNSSSTEELVCDIWKVDAQGQVR